MAKSNKHIKKKPKEIYLDYASSALSMSANPSAIHALGIKERNKIEKARILVAQIIGAHPDEIIFTSGATESNNLAILGVRSGHVVTTNIEHASVLEPVKHRGDATIVEVSPSGIVDPKEIKKSLKESTVLISVMYANNEIGTIQPIREIAKEIRHFNKINNREGANKILFHIDAVQAINYLDINVERLGVDLMSFNGAKIYGPKGVGVLYVKRNTPIGRIMFGGEQEMGLRPGTENTASIISLAECLALTEKIKTKESKRLEALRDFFFKELAKLNLVVNGDPTNRLPNNVNITIPNIPSDLLVIELSARGIYASSKSACKSGDGKASHVIQAINPSLKDTDGSIRFSLGRQTTKQDIVITIKAMKEILSKLEKWYH